MIDLARTYSYLREATSDINEHLQTLYRYGSKVDHITEFGVRGGVSTIAWLYCNPDKLISYDINPIPPILAENLVYSDKFRFIQADVLKIEIEETDLLFIDTYHSYTQISQELALHGNKARRYLIFHDTETFGDRGMDGETPGLKVAIDEFMRDNHCWTVAEHFKNNNGLTILQRGLT